MTEDRPTEKVDDENACRAECAKERDGGERLTEQDLQRSPRYGKLLIANIMRCRRIPILDRAWQASLFCAVAFGIASVSTPALADPLMLRGDAIVDTQSEAQSPLGLLVLQGEDKRQPWISTEGLVWTGARADGSGMFHADDITGDLLVLAVHLHAPHNLAEVRVGRFVLATGAIFPVQMDGADIIGRTPWGTSLEAFGGAPVVPRFGARAYDWLAGTRAAQSIASKVTVGVSYMQRREDGDISDEELGADLAAAPARWLDLAAKGAYDLTNPGIADARLSAATRVGPLRVELFGSELSPGRILPATSLFSVLGDFPSESVGGTIRWRAAPRLDLLASGAGQLVGGELGANGWVRATLRLDDRGDGNLGVEVRRVDVIMTRWTGFRVVAARPLGRGFRFSTEVEIVVPDAPNGQGIAWPWGLMALSWKSKSGWEIAGATEAASTPEYRYEFNALARISKTLEFKVK
jgi:hypothetical protein